VEFDSAINIIVVESGPIRYGLVVDGLFDSEEIVVKPLGQHLTSSPCLTGATILGDGRVALILDVPGIAAQAELQSQASDDDQDSAETEGDLSGNSEEQTVLLFTNEPSEQFAIPMTMITRIERIRADQIDSVGGHDLLQYRGMSLPLLSLENVITAKPREPLKHVYVIVFEAAGCEIGLVAQDLVDIRVVPADFDSVTFCEDGVCGSQVIDGRTTRAIDLVEIARRVRPEWFERADALREEDSGDGISIQKKGPTILLAEDSAFFRRQVKGVLESEGCRVIDCEDGQIAWQTLKSEKFDIDIVLTDIEMPNMNGLQLSRHIKDHENYQHLPVIALTSLAGQEDRRRGQEAGIDEYQVKLDRERLIATVRHYAQTPGNIPAGSIA
jgi:two-component system chemotaxis sensor kinase CheA